MDAMAATLSFVIAKSGRTSTARSTNRRTAADCRADSTLGAAAPRRRRKRQRRHREQLLAAHVQRLAARDQRGDAGARPQQFRESRGRNDHLLEIVQQEQHVLSGETGFQGIERQRFADLLEFDRANDRGEHAVRVALRRQIDEEQSVIEAIELIGGCLQGQSGLSHPARADQRDQPGLVVDERPQVTQLGVPPEENGNLCRQIIGALVEGRKRRKSLGKSRSDDLEQSQRLGEILEAVLAEVAQLHLRRQSSADRFGNGARQQNLTAVSGRHDACRAVNRRTEIIAATLLGVAKVHADPDPQRAGFLPVFVLQVLLDADARERGGDGLLEHRHHAVAGGLDDRAAVLFDASPQDRVVARNRRAHRRRMRLPHPGARFDIGKPIASGNRRLSHWGQTTSSMRVVAP